MSTLLIRGRTRFPGFLWLVLPLLSFTVGINQCTETDPNDIDDDNDDWTENQGDCNDADSSVYPGAEDLCGDGVDQDCDGIIDEGATETCDGADNDCDSEVDEGFDRDRDGYTSCGGDCNDDDEETNPDAPESCDGEDNNCDGHIDEGFDRDRDGYSSCGGDCNDNDEATNPEASEVCDGADNNCDGRIDEGCPVTRTPAPGDLVITEIMNDPAAVTDANGEWFEIYNLSPDTLDLTGLIISDNIGSFSVNRFITIRPEGYLIFGNNGDIATNGGIAVDYAYGNALALANGSDLVRLTSITDALLDLVSYTNTTFPATPGASKTLDPDRYSPTANDTGSNWCNAVTVLESGDKATPGALNDQCF